MQLAIAEFSDASIPGAKNFQLEAVQLKTKVTSSTMLGKAMRFCFVKTSAKPQDAAATPRLPCRP